jgi:hypothetical protein
MEYRTYAVDKRDKEPLLRFILSALDAEGCRLLRASDPRQAPFRITFETAAGERIGVIVYAFLANSRVTKNRPDDEHRFQVKYGSDDKRLHALWQDPFSLYTTLFCGIDPEREIFVGADPVLHSPTRFFISIEFKREHVETIRARDWYAWERDHRAADDRPVEVLVGGTAKSFLRYVKFEREAFAEDQGHRQLLAEEITRPDFAKLLAGLPEPTGPMPQPEQIHALANEFELSETEILDVIAHARRLKMAVRGWVAEEHLVRTLTKVRGVTDCKRNDEEGAPDVSLRFEGDPLSVECKNVLRNTAAGGIPRIDFQRTRASKSDPSSRYYTPSDFDVVAACLHAVSERWEYRYVLPGRLERHRTYSQKLSNNVKVDDRWSANAADVLRAAAKR